MQPDKRQFPGLALVIALLLVAGVACNSAEPVERIGSPTRAVTQVTEAENTPKDSVKEVRPKLSGEDLVTLQGNLGTEPETFDPVMVADPASLDCTANLFVALTRYDPVSSAVLPYLATRWDVSADGLVYTFHLRDDVQWVQYNRVTGLVSAQRPVVAGDVEYGIKRALNPETGAPYAYVLHIIKNAARAHAGDQEVTLDDVGVRALDSATVEFVLERPASYFPATLAMWVAKPLPVEPIQTHGVRWDEADTIWTNGPFMLTLWTPNQLVRLEKNPFWVAAGEVQIEVIEMLMVIDAITGLRLYESNELDTALVPPTELRKVREDNLLSQQYSRRAMPCTYYYGFTTTKPPFDDLRVRTAFAAAIDRDRLAQFVLVEEAVIPTSSFAPPGTFGAPPPGTVGLSYDPVLAQASLQEYLDEMGFDDVADFAAEYDIVLGINTGETHSRIANSIQSMWRETLGVNVRLEDQEWDSYLETTRSTSPVEESYHIFRMGWCADYPDEHNWLYDVFHYLDGANRVRRRCSDPNCLVYAGPAEFDRLVERAAQETDPALRAEFYGRAEEILAREEVVAAFLFHHASYDVTKPWLERDYPLMGGANWYEWRIDWAAKSANR